jgi:hypothetical protein
MIKKLVCFGCSWTFGSELIDPALKIEGFDSNDAEHCPDNWNYRSTHTYASLVAQHFGLELVNLSFPGSSIESMRWNFLWWLGQHSRDNDSLLIFGLTDSTRQSWFNPLHKRQQSDPPWHNHIHSTWLQQPNDLINKHWYALQKDWMSLSYSSVWAEYNFVQAITLFDYARAEYKLPTIQVNMIANPYPGSVPSLLYPGTSFNEILTTQQKTSSVNLFAEKGHPNENGHRAIADVLIEHITGSKILVDNI